MAHFYGMLKGARGQATRCGTQSSGMHATAASWQGAAVASLFRGPLGGVDEACITLERWKGAGGFARLYVGPVGECNPRPGAAGGLLGECADVLADLLGTLEPDPDMPMEDHGCTLLRSRVASLLRRMGRDGAA